MVEPFPAFEDAIRAMGMAPPPHITPGRFHRFPGAGKGPSNKSGWCKLFHGGKAGVYGDWAQGISKTWFAIPASQFAKDELETFAKQIKASKAHAEREKRQAERKTANKANTIWQKATPASPDHPYLVRKGISSHCARVSRGDLVLPVLDFDGRLTSLQFISPQGEKRLLQWGRKKGCCIPIDGELEPVERVMICEGWATGCTIAEHVPDTLVLAAIDANNLEPVAVQARRQWPEAELMIAGDDDRGKETNIGRAKARQAAVAANAHLVMPQWPDGAPLGLSDFNDLATWCKGTAKPFDILENHSEPILEWADLVPLTTNNLPRLESPMLPTWAGDFAMALSKHTETPLELAVGMVLATCATAVARRLKVVVREGYEEPCNLYLIVALPSGTRKSAVQSQATAPLMEWENAQEKAKSAEIQRIQSERLTTEARIKAVRQQAAKEKGEATRKALADEAMALEAKLPVVPTFPQLWTSDSTPEKLGVLLNQNGECMAWLSSEGGIFDIFQGRYSKGIPNLDLLLKAHSRDAERVDRGSRPDLNLKAPCLTIGLSPQPEVLHGLADKPGFRGRGLLARFLYLLPESNLGYRSHRPCPIPSPIANAYHHGIRSMLNWQANQDENQNTIPYALRLSKKASQAALAYTREVEKKMLPGAPLESFTDWAGKAAGAAIRIAGVFHAIQYADAQPWQQEISEATFREAVSLLDIIEAHSLAALGTMGTDPALSAARLVWDWIDRKKSTSLCVRDVFSGLRHRFSKVTHVKDALALLEERGYLILQEHASNGPGRPKSSSILIRPDIVMGWQ